MMRFKPFALLLMMMALAVGAQAAEQPDTAPAKDDLVKTTDTLRPIVKMETTLGDIVLELDAHKAPVSVLNFLRYAEDGYYNDTIFHRVIPTFMIQGGGFYPDMEKKEKGLRKPIVNEWTNGLKNVNFTIAMARTGGDPDSATSQFFINVKNHGMLDKPQADGAGYAVFGKVVGGFDTIEKIRTADRFNHPKYPDKSPVNPVKPIIINDVRLVSEFDHEAARKQVDAIKAEKARFVAEKQAKTLEMLKDTIAQVEEKAGAKIQTTDSGLMIAIARKGTGDKSPTPADTVTAHYEGTLIDGFVFDSSYARDAPLTYKLGNLIPGWQEGMGMMTTGGMSYMIIPPELGYGSRDMGEIPPNSWLIFKVELLEVK